MPFVDVDGRIGGAAFWQIAGIAANVGTSGAMTVMLSVVVVAHCPAAGVNVYTVVPGVAVLTAGVQVPEIPF
jgi:hypothetical protein